MHAGTEQEDEDLDGDEGVDVPVEDMTRDERASHLQEQLAIQYRARYLSHTSALCKLASLAPQSPFQLMHVSQPTSVPDCFCLLIMKV